MHEEGERRGGGLSGMGERERGEKSFFVCGDDGGNGFCWACAIGWPPPPPLVHVAGRRQRLKDLKTSFAQCFENGEELEII
jgi:hypothetical protein